MVSCITLMKAKQKKKLPVNLPKKLDVQAQIQNDRCQDCCIFKFPRSSVHGKHLMRLQRCDDAAQFDLCTSLVCNSQTFWNSNYSHCNFCRF